MPLQSPPAPQSPPARQSPDAPQGAGPQTAAVLPADRRRKAAMVVQLLLGGGQKLALARLPEDTQVALTRELAALRLVDRATLEAAVTEFATALENIGIAATGGVEDTLASLNGQISPAAQARLRRELAAARGVDPWQAVIALPAAKLVPAMERESVEVAAIALGKLPVAKAAELLGKISGDRARRITRAMATTAAVSPDTVALIGKALATDYASPPDAAFLDPPEDRLGAILNSSPSQTREDVLATLATDDAGFAESVRRRLLTLADLPDRLNPLDVPRLLRGVPQDEVVLALSYASSQEAEAASVDFILGNLSLRMADTLREEIAARPLPRRKEGEAACAALLSNLRSRIDAGEITLLPPENEEDLP